MPDLIGLAGPWFSPEHCYNDSNVYVSSEWRKVAKFSVIRNNSLRTWVRILLYQLSAPSKVIHRLFVRLFSGATALQWARASQFTRFLDHTQRGTTVGRTPLDEWSARLRDLYLHNTQHSQQKDIHAPGWDLNPQSQQGSVLRPRGHWDRRYTDCGQREM